MPEWISVSASDVRSPSRSHPDLKLLRGLVWVNAAVPLVLLAYDAWRHRLGANGVNFALHTTGLVALLLFVMSLMVTPLKRLTGISELVASRRTLGLYGFFYLVVHFAIFFVFDRDGSVSSTLEEIVKRPYLQIGIVALLLYVPLAVTSTDRMISRLGPRRWKRLHRLTYVATSLGALHYILLVKSDLRQPIVFATILGGLLTYRVVAHFVDRRRLAKKRPWSGELRVARTTDETHDVRTFRFVPASGGKLPFTHRAGQYLNLSLVIDGHRQNRSYTIASAPTQSDYCEITVKRVGGGIASNHLHDALREGAVVKVTAPSGRFVFDETSSRVLLVAGGVGITPLMSMVRSLTDRRWKGRVDLVFSVKTERDIVFARELTEIAERASDFHLHVTLTREPPETEWSGARGPINEELIRKIAPDLADVPIFVCGPEPMMEAMKRLFGELGAPPENVHVEAFLSPPRAPISQAEVDDVQAEEGEPLPSNGSGTTVQFATSGTSASVEEGQTLLEAAEDVGVEIPFDCRSGICGQCKTKLLRGRVVMEVQDALTADDRKNRLVLACQARPVRDVVVDA